VPLWGKHRYLGSVDSWGLLCGVKSSSKCSLLVRHQDFVLEKVLMGSDESAPWEGVSTSKGQEYSPSEVTDSAVGTSLGVLFRK
jgi:hypothetical protein